MNLQEVYDKLQVEKEYYAVGVNVQEHREVSEWILKLAAALVDIMCGMKDHDVQGETGYDEQRCQEICKVRKEAEDLLREIGRRES